jgi:2-phosphoglycerate kinase
MRQELRQRGSEAVVIEMLLTLDDERLHRARLLRRVRCDPAMPGVRHVQNFAAVRALQDQLRDLARANGVVAHEVSTEKLLVEWIVDHTLAAVGLLPGAA